MQTTGTDLKVERIRANVTIISLAARMGLSRQAIWGLERSALVDEVRARAYREALASMRVVTETSARGAA
jgi:transcriptional regulator with XRE-family HTH domain